MAIRKINSRAIADGAVATADLDDNPLTIDSLTVDTNTLVVDAANNLVGVGTSAPSGAKLEIFTGSTSSDGLKINRFGSGVYYSTLRQDSHGLAIRVGDGSTIAERVAITPNGITFNGDTAAANALDDYEIGAFAPVYAISGGSVTTGTNAGRYVKVGDFVFFTFRLRTTAVSGTGALTMTLPFTSSSENRSGGSRGYARDWGVDMPEFTIYTPPSSSVAFFYRHAMNVSTAQSVTGSQMGTGGDDNVLEGSIVYRSA